MSAAATRAAATAAGASSQKRPYPQSSKQGAQGSRLIVKLTVGVALVSVLLPLVAAWFVSGICMRPPWYRHSRENAETGKPWEIPRDGKTFRGHMGYVSNPKHDFGIDYEDVSFPSHNPSTHYTLRGWHVPSTLPDAKVGLILLHGGGHDRRECLRIVPFLHAAGYPVLMYDSSEHGASDGDGYGLGFGFRERMDLVGAIDYAKTKLGWTKVAAFGTSVGAVTVIKAAVMDERLDAIIIENPFTSIDDLLRHAIRTALGQSGFGGRDITRFGFFAQVLTKVGSLIPPQFVDLCLAVTRLRVGGWGQPNAIDLIEKVSPRPIFLIHSAEDDVVPIDQGEAIFARAKEPKEILTTEKGKHAAVYNDNKELFTQRFLSFIKKTIGEPTKPNA